MKFITIGDIHGRNVWKIILDKNISYDKIIFLGDYVDSFVKNNLDIKHNLIEILNFKKSNKDNIILLWGNHDIQYLYNYGKHGCSGFRPEAYWDLHEIFNNNKKLFQLSFQYKNYLWTHAGVHKGWYKFIFKRLINDHINDDKSLSEQLNRSFEFNDDEIFYVGRDRGGYHDVGGPLWIDKNTIYSKPLNGFNQIVGHTPVSRIITKKIDNNTSITFCDCFDNYIIEDDDTILTKLYILDL